MEIVIEVKGGSRDIGLEKVGELIFTDYQWTRYSVSFVECDRVHDLGSISKEDIKRLSLAT